MKINFTNQQFKTLVKMIYLGDWLANSIRVSGEEIEEYKDFEQYICSFASSYDLENLIEFSKEFDRYFSTAELEESPDILKLIEEYDEEIFWQELMFRMARRDFERDYRKEEIEKMDWEESVKKEHPYIEKYGCEFEKYGIERMEINNSDLNYE